MFFETSAAWLITAFLHLGLLLLLARFLTARMSSGAWREGVWRGALVGALITASLQVQFGSGPLVWKPFSAEVGRGNSAPTSIAVGVSQIPPSAEISDASLSAEPATGPNTSPILAAIGWREISTGVVSLWALIALGLCLRQVRERRRFLKALSRRAVDPLTDEGQRLQALMPGSSRARGLHLTLTPQGSSPVVISPRELCVPQRVLEELTDEELQAALAHECAHIERRDSRWLRAYALLESLLFFQPLVRVATANLRAEAELAADDRAVEGGADPLGLARCLARVASWEPGVPLGLSAMVRRDSSLVSRVARLTSKRHTPSSSSSSWWAAGLLASGTLALACGGPGMSHELTYLEDSEFHGRVVTVVLPNEHEVIVESKSFQVPAQWSQFKEDMLTRGARLPGTHDGEVSDLRVLIDVKAGVTFRPVQKLMENLAYVQVWRLEFVTEGSETIRVPLPHDLHDLDAPIEEELLEEGEVVELRIESSPDDPQSLVGVLSDRIEIRMTVDSAEPRALVWRVDAKDFQSIEAVRENLRQRQSAHPIERVVIDARQGILYGDVVQILDSLIEVGMSEASIVFVGAYME